MSQAESSAIEPKRPQRTASPPSQHVATIADTASIEAYIILCKFKSAASRVPGLMVLHNDRTFNNAPSCRHLYLLILTCWSSCSQRTLIAHMQRSTTRYHQKILSASSSSALSQTKQHQYKTSKSFLTKEISCAVLNLIYCLQHTGQYSVALGISRKPLKLLSPLHQDESIHEEVKLKEAMSTISDFHGQFIPKDKPDGLAVYNLSITMTMPKCGHHYHSKSHAS